MKYCRKTAYSKYDKDIYGVYHKISGKNAKGGDQLHRAIRRGTSTKFKMNSALQYKH